MSKRRSAPKDVQAADAAVLKVQNAMADVMAKLEEQMEQLSTMSDLYLDQGLLGAHCEAQQMRDQAAARLKEMRQKLGLPPSEPPAAPTRAPPSLAPAAPPPPAKAPAKAAAAEARPPTAPAPVTVRSIGVTRDSEGWVSPACLGEGGLAGPRYRWRPGTSTGASLEVLGPAAAEGSSAEVDVAPRTVRCSWPETGWALSLPLGFVADCEGSGAKRKRQGGLLLSLAELQPAPRHEVALAAELSLPEGNGVCDSFLSGEEADQVRERLLEMWRTGECRPGEVEGRQGQGTARVRSDEYTYGADGDATLAIFTRRLDLLVVELCRTVPDLKDLSLVRGKPMVAVYNGAGSRYGPHFDANRGSNGRVLTCVLYLNPFWREGDGAELLLWPHARTLEPDGPTRKVQPLHGRLAVFLCNSRNLHEVSPVTAERTLEPRIAVSCWYYDASVLPSLAATEKTSDAPV